MALQSKSTAASTLHLALVAIAVRLPAELQQVDIASNVYCNIIPLVSSEVL